MTSQQFESDVLRLVAVILGDAGFTITELTVETHEDFEPSDAGSPRGSRSLLLAQNRFFIVAIGATSTFAELSALEASATSALGHLVTSSQLGGKQWDVYLVLFAEQSLPDDGQTASQLVRINYDVQFVRRLAHVGVRPEIRELASLLRPFLPLAASSRPEVLQDGLALLEAELPAHGIDTQFAGRAVAAFREGGSLGSV